MPHLSNVSLTPVDFLILSFYEVSVTGESHQREFTYGCKLGSNEKLGIASTKKEAKQIAAREMLQCIGDDCNADEIDNGADSSGRGWVLPLQEIPSVEEVLEEYRRLRKPHIQPVEDGLRNRQNFFLKLPEADRSMAQHLLMFYRPELFSAKDIVDEVCKVLQLQYRLESLSSGFKVFVLAETRYDCVIIEKANVLFEKVIDYLKNMINLQNPVEMVNNNF